MNQRHPYLQAGLLTIVAGIADAIGYLTMGGIFAANMTGNTVLAGISAAEAANRTYLYYHRIAFGSRVLFEPQFALGLNVTDKVSVEASYTHLSNGQIFHQGKNQGLDDAGVRLNYRFGK